MHGPIFAHIGLRATRRRRRRVQQACRMKMRAISQDTPGGPEVLKMVEVDKPVPGPTEVLVRVHAAGSTPPTGRPGPAAACGATPPFVLGCDVSGVVEAVGLRRDAVPARATRSSACPASRAATAPTPSTSPRPSRHFARKPAGLDHVAGGRDAARRADRLAGAGGRRPASGPASACWSTPRPAASGTSPCRSPRRAART